MLTISSMSEKSTPSQEPEPIPLDTTTDVDETCELNKYQFAGIRNMPPGSLRIFSGMYSDDEYEAAAKYTREKRLAEHKKCVHCKIEGLKKELAELKSDVILNKYAKQDSGCTIM